MREGERGWERAREDERGRAQLRKRKRAKAREEERERERERKRAKTREKERENVTYFPLIFPLFCLSKRKKGNMKLDCVGARKGI